ncbi:MAG TPA: hypothetical protein PLW27_06390 [Kiritimatiellia bacterium]|jgi:hypothetical protein|nr:hypothetical protein [Kiritimatiellia bacterium]
MKRLGMKLSAIMIAIVSLTVLVHSVLGAPPSWKWRVDVIPAAGTNEVTMYASAGGQVEWVRWNRIDAASSNCASVVTLVSGADGWATPLGTLAVSNASAAVSAATGSASATNGQWRTGDTLTVTSAGVTNGTVAVGYWYYE